MIRTRFFRFSPLQSFLPHSITRLSGKQERLDTTRLSMHDAKLQSQQLGERLTALQTELGDSELRRAETESQLRQANSLLSQRQQEDQELNRRLQLVRSISIKFCSFNYFFVLL
ncbi:unnamed protein product [Protopolystoma xenopodis]|uniref:Uncharacterized protein n=1 Tax=Protopolystoma xenopodis TaxID=117903 RepID=A0A448X9S7_9PLAT|nr:unnamed protein product [Protopolystoma xenopodis]